MHKPAVVLVFLTVVMFPAVVLGDAFSSIVDDGRLKISLSYPPEVRVGSCFSLVFQTTFMGSVSVDKLKLTVTYVSEAGNIVLLSDTIVSSVRSFVAGDVISKTYGICVPAAVRTDPSITANLYINYTRDSSYQPLTHNWMLAVVRSRTYDDLLHELSVAKQAIDSLRSIVSDLQNQINSLRARLEEALKESARLSASLEDAREQIKAANARYEMLSREYKDLNQRYLDTVADLRALEALHRSLNNQHAALSENYRILLNDYRNLTGEFTALQASFTQLKSLYNELTNRHEAAKQNIGYLQSQLDETRSMLHDMQLRYSMLSGENTLHRNLAYTQAFVLVGLATGLTSVAASRRWRREQRRESPALPPPPPPPPELMRERWG
ncbi:MAG: hypothetical protein QXU87_11005 [Candidatus Caldarchaeum sp.]|uniref:Uncharacterized protein n=1 Tax=Caldiarchaeum subterraneum TaxID=311458 RepID=A0A7C5L7R3_CALS0